ncbi:MAG: SDR family NAD(P)-dependent oxidoreductase [Candidatus Latescibacterota bacterium]|nr:MAG: SDR family NAD(P)-dependent oxidoreductase [Candidatus Latescibacterota bacterium]
MPNAIVIGATSGIGRALAVELARQGYKVGATGRRVERLNQLENEFPDRILTRPMDVRDVAAAPDALRELIVEMHGVDVIVINAGVLFRDADWGGIEAMIDTNVTGFVATAEAAMGYFLDRRSGHLVGISSIAAIRGAKGSPVYNASKAFECTYMDGLRHRIAKTKLPIHVTDIRPGFVDTKMIADRGGLFWVASPEKVARQIIDAIHKKKKRTYITKRWHAIAWLAKTVPDWIYHKW